MPYSTQARKLLEARHVVGICQIENTHFSLRNCLYEGLCILQFWIARTVCPGEGATIMAAAMGAV
jgi:hypothetical protein